MGENEDTTSAERARVTSRLRQLRERDSWLMGTYAEHVVAEALPGAEPSTSSFAAWDLDWEGISIEVKCSTERQTGATEATKPSPAKWSVPPHYAWNHEAEDWHPGDKKRWAKVYVLARHEGFDHAKGWSFFVVPCWWLDARFSVTVTGGSLRGDGWAIRPRKSPQGCPSRSAECRAGRRLTRLGCRHGSRATPKLAVHTTPLRLPTAAQAERTSLQTNTCPSPSPTPSA